jgi:hypothetical protein
VYGRVVGFGFAFGNGDGALDFVYGKSGEGYRLEFLGAVIRSSLSVLGLGASHSCKLIRRGFPPKKYHGSLNRGNSAVERMRSGITPICA